MTQQREPERPPVGTPDAARTRERSTRARHLIPLNIRGKIILPYMILTLIVATVGTYVVIRLVAGSLDERLDNQLGDAWGVVSDELARREVKHVESARAVAFTVGLAEALRDGDKESAVTLAQPAAAAQGIECLILVDVQGQAILHGLQQDDGRFEIIEQPVTPSGLWMAQTLLEGGNPSALPRRSLGLHRYDQRYYYLTAIPVPLNDRVVGVAIVGSSVDTLLLHFRDTALAHVTIYAEDGKAIATTHSAPLKDLSIDPASYLSIASGTDVTVGGTAVDINERSYRLAIGPLRVGSDTLGVFAVALPTNFITEHGQTSRNTYFAIFATATAAVIVMGYLISQRITTPIDRLVYTSQAVAEGDLAQRTGIVGGDEIGFLAETFDEMTGRLEERTRALEEALGRLKAILSSIGDGVLLEDPQHNLIPLNATAEVLIQEMTGDFLLAPLRELSSTGRRASTEAQEDTWLVDRRRFEVGKRVISAHSAPVRTDSGEQLGTVIVLRNVTAEAEAERLKDAFVAHVSHELRTPLTAIKGYSELMLIGATGALSNEQRKFTDTIHRHTEKLVSMINALLDFSEMEAWDRLTVQRFPVELSYLVKETAEEWRPQMEEKGLTFEVDVPPEITPVNADVKRLRWVIVNLVRNAWQYTPEGGCVTVHLHEQNSSVVLDVIDTGVGISHEDQAKIFGRFYRVSRTTSDTRGIGLGLYISQAIVKAHDGTIHVSSKEGAGSTFSVTLPALREHKGKE